jgi:hypothetical protein
MATLSAGCAKLSAIENLCLNVLLGATLLAVLASSPAQACKAQGSFFDYRNCSESDPSVLAEPGEVLQEPGPATDSPAKSGTARTAAAKADAARISPAKPEKARAERPEKPVPGGPDTRLVIADRSGRSLTLGCIGGGAALAFDFGTPMSAEGYRKEIYYAIDGGEPRIAELAPAKRKTALGIWQDYRAAPLMAQILSAGLLSVEATAADGSDIKLQFEISPDPASVKRLKQSCRL